ncbi:TonB C-terminal domain-containing protein [Undibacterium sp. RuTC16W]|uniref:TonB C-terminal domain-containing protein n=1 Tax=Undibacterium sp. RuTC16W TaxID=3413048 RepID=UPI003BF37E59
MSITLGGQAFGLPGLNFPWKERRLGANDLLILLLPAQPTTSTSAPEPAERPKEMLSAVNTPAVSGKPTLMTTSDPAVEHGEITTAVIPPPIPATTPVIATAPPVETVITSQKRLDPQPTAVEMTSVVQNTPAQVHKISLPNNADSTPPKPVKQNIQEQVPEQIALEREKQNTEELKQAELIATAQRENKQQEQVKQDAARAEQTAKNTAAQVELERQKVERQELARQEELRREALQKEQARQNEMTQQELARADASRAEASRKETARQEQIRQAQLNAARQEQLRQDAARAEQTAKNEAVRKEAERLEAQRQELAQQEKLRRDAAQKELARQTEQAKQETARQELAKAEAARLEAGRKEAARQEQIRQTQLDTARQEQLRQDAVRAEQAAKSEAARKETERVAAERQELARQEGLHQESLRREALQREQAKQERDKLEQVQRERAEYETAREERLRAIGKQLNEEAAQRDAALKNPSRTLLPSVSSLRRGWLLGRADANADLVLYAEAMSRKIERNMAFDMIREVVKQSHVQPLVTVAIRADGSVEKVTFVVSSGVAAIDDAIRKVVASQAPYPAFTPALARQYDVIEIRRTWIFDVTIRLQ